MATTQELRNYAERLPPIYQEILGSFPRVEPTRRAGYGLAIQTIFSHFQNRDLPFTLGQIVEACDQLQRSGLVEIKHRIFVHPTARGEEIVAALTGLQPKEAAVPALPAPPV